MVCEDRLFHNCFIGLEQIVKIKKKIIIFGAGADGIRLYKEIFPKRNIAYFVDNGETEGFSVFGNKLLDFDCLMKEYQGECIIVASLRYYNEIAGQLLSNHFIGGENFYIWDGVSGIEDKFIVENTKKFAEFNKKIWGKAGNRNPEKKILIPYRNTSEIVFAPWSYCANYLAGKYDAEIYCIGGVRDIPNERLMELYRSFHVAGFIDETIDENLKGEADRIFREIWPNIHTKHDIKEIKVYGENFGTDILRDYLRFNFPRLYMDDRSLKKQIKEMIGYIVFWHQYFREFYQTVKAVILWDGIYYREGIIRKIAYGYGIPVYSVINYTACRLEHDLVFSFEHYKKYFYMLTERERQEGTEWAKKQLDRHLKGYIGKERIIYKSAFGHKSDRPVLEQNGRLKVMICPHYMEDDAFPYGDDMLFDDQWDWLEFLGRLSNQLPYDWYLKQHPIEKELGDKLFKDYVAEYPNIKLLPKMISPIQLYEEGMRVALTIHGRMGYEYPLIGINVINAGYNPHISFDFNLNPGSVDEYTAILENLESLDFSIDKEEIYQFYCIEYGYLVHRERDFNNEAYIDERLKDIRGLVVSKTKASTELFRIYVDEMTEERHRSLLKFYSNLIEEMDQYKEGIFYKKELPV